MTERGSVCFCECVSLVEIHTAERPVISVLFLVFIRLIRMEKTTFSLNVPPLWSWTIIRNSFDSFTFFVLVVELFTFFPQTDGVTPKLHHTLHVVFQNKTPRADSRSYIASKQTKKRKRLFHYVASSLVAEAQK